MAEDMNEFPEKDKHERMRREHREHIDIAIPAISCYVDWSMKAKYSISRGQSQFPALCRCRETTAITRNGEVVAFIVPRSRMEALVEQMEILSNPEAMKAIRRARSGKAKDHPLKALDED